MAIQGVDYSSSRPDPACLYQEGKRFVVRYTNLGAARAKTLVFTEAKKLTDAGLRIVTVFEETAGHMLDGAAAGTAAARASWAQGKAAGMHPDAPHYFALDVDPTNLTSIQWSRCAAYLDAAAAVLGRHRVGLYGNDEAIDRLRDHASFYWQTYAWSRDENDAVRWADGLHLRQYKNGVTLCGGSVDLDDALTPYYGQWGVNVFMPSDLERAQALARSCDPIPYRMTVEISRDGIDCSGMMSLMCNSLLNKDNVWVRLFATGTIRDLVDAGRLPFLHPGLGDDGDFNIGVIYPWEMSSGIGHTAGTLGGLNVESRGGDGVVIGSAARGATHSLFRHHYHMKIDSAGNIGEEDDMSAADVEAIKDHVTQQTNYAVRSLDHGNRDVVGVNNHLGTVRSDLAALKTLLTGQADDETKILAAIAAQRMDPAALASVIAAKLQESGVIQADVDEEALSARLSTAVTEALQQVTFTATSRDQSTG